MITPCDHVTLSQYTTKATLTQTEADNIHRLMPNNSWLTPKECRWRYPVSNEGSAIEGVHAITYTQPIRKSRIDPNSAESTQPWLIKGETRSTYYRNLAHAPQHARILGILPEWVTQAEGLKLYRVVASLAHVHKRDIDGLWVGVADVLRESKGEPPAFTLSRVDGLE